MKKLSLSLLLPVCIFTNVFSQNVIDYSSLNVVPCNVFGSPTTVSGYIHTSVKGRIFYDISEGAIALLGKGTKGSEYQFNYPTLTGHTYRITISSREKLNPTGSVVVVGLTSQQTAGNACDPETVTTTYTNGKTFHVYSSPNLMDYTDQITATQNSGYIAVKAYVDPQFVTSNTYDIGTYIRKITITDLTPSPVFTISSSISSRDCGANLLGVNFTVSAQNASNITGYDYTVEPYQWTYGVPAQTVINTIHSTSNTIQLTPNACGSGSTLTVTPYISGVAMPMYAVTKTITINIPSYVISGPSSLSTASGLYYLQNAGTGTVPTPPCSATPTWSINNTSLATLSVNSAYNVGLSANTGGFGGPATGDVILTSAMTMCGKSSVTTKSVHISSGLKSAPKTSSDESFTEEILAYPNPTDGKFSIKLNTPVENERLIITDIVGQAIMNNKVSGTDILVDISSMPDGIYLFKLNSQSGIKSGKIIKKN